jgi:hypothetical protein
MSECVLCASLQVSKDCFVNKDAYKPMDEKTNEVSCATGVPEVVLHPSWFLLCKVVRTIGLLSSAQPTKRSKPNSPIALLIQLLLLLRQHHRQGVRH